MPSASSWSSASPPLDGVALQRHGRGDQRGGHGDRCRDDRGDGRLRGAGGEQRTQRVRDALPCGSELRRRHGRGLGGQRLGHGHRLR